MTATYYVCRIFTFEREVEITMTDQEREMLLERFGSWCSVWCAVVPTKEDGYPRQKLRNRSRDTNRKSHSETDWLKPGNAQTRPAGGRTGLCVEAVKITLQCT